MSNPSKEFPVTDRHDVQRNAVPGKFNRLHLIFVLGVSLILGAAGIKALWTLLQFLYLAYHVRISGDAALYFTVGRGILNGLKPYADLYESKPPGVFLLSALSLWLNGGSLLYSLVHILSILAIPAALIALTWHSSRTRTRTLRFLLAMGALLYGCGVALYATDFTGFVQPEAFGAFFGVIYVVTLADGKPLSGQRVAIATLCILGAIGMKEPFLFSLLATALILAENNRSLVRTFLVPLILALVAGVILLALCGYLKAYVTIYLPDILSTRVATSKIYQLGKNLEIPDVPNPLWLRGLSFFTFTETLRWDSPFPLISFAVILVWVARPLFSTARPKTALLSVLSIMCSGWMMHKTYLYLQLLEIINFQFPWSDPFFRSLSIATAGVVSAWCASLFCVFTFDRDNFGTVVRSIAAIYLATIAVSVSGEYSHNLVIAVPTVLATITGLVRTAPRLSFNKPLLAVLSAVAVVLCVMPFFQYPKGMYTTKLTLQNAENAAANRRQRIGEHLDSLMDRCEYQRFGTLGEFAAGYMLHSPYQAPYGIARAFADHPNVVFRSKFYDDLKEAPIVLMESGAEFTPHALERTLSGPLGRGTCSRGASGNMTGNEKPRLIAGCRHL